MMRTAKKKWTPRLLQRKFPEKLYLPILALAVETVLPYLSAPTWATFSVEYFLILSFVFYNLKLKSLWPYWMGAGALMNFTVIAANGFNMPVSPSVFSPQVDQVFFESLINGEIYGYTLANAGTVLPFLGDIIGISPFGRLMGFASIGDVLLLVGAAIAIYRMK
jgi:hypothetical protein